MIDRVKGLATGRINKVVSRIKPGHGGVGKPGGDHGRGNSHTGLDRVNESARKSGAISDKGYDKRTIPTKPMGSKPRGNYEAVAGSSKKKRSIMRHNEAADGLSNMGFDVEMIEPKKGPNGNEIPTADFKVDGKYFDVYSPGASKTPSKMRTKIRNKVKKGQTDRVIVNLDDSPVSHDVLRDYLAKDGISGLKEIITIKNGEINYIFPFE